MKALTISISLLLVSQLGIAQPDVVEGGVNILRNRTGQTFYYMFSDNQECGVCKSCANENCCQCLTLPKEFNKVNADETIEFDYGGKFLQIYQFNEDKSVMKIDQFKLNKKHESVIIIKGLNSEGILND
ncbi:MAG: hypothetical protein AB7O48_14880 [Cyclobacteriaceae bacterium]